MKKILVIEDDRIMRENMAELLELSGYEVFVAENGKEGIVQARELMPDLIVCDIKMPDLDGYGVLHILGQNHRTAAIPFIFVTAKTGRSDRRKGMEMGADDYLTKPFEDTELLKTVEARLEKHKIVAKNYPGDATGLVEFIKDAGMLTSLANHFEASQLRDYSAKEMVFRPGDHPRFLYFIDSGRVKIYRVNPDGKEFITNIFHPGDFFGHQSIFEGRPYVETAEMLEPGKILLVPKDDFLALLNRNREVANKLIRMISKDLTEKGEELIRMAYDSVRKRVAMKLLALLPEEAGNETIVISRTNLAALVGTTPETLVRTLTELRELEIIQTDSQKIILLDRNRLHDLAEAW